MGTKNLNPNEAAALAAFRDAYNAARPSTHPNLEEVSYQVSTSSLPKCGWRPLDDATLYRFLCADRRDGQFFPDKSATRLKNSLVFRRNGNVDGLLSRPPPGLDVYQSLRVRVFTGRDHAGRPVMFERL